MSISGGTMQVGSLNAPANLNVSLTGAGSELIVNHNVLLGAGCGLSADANQTLLIGGNFQYATTSASALSLAGASVQFDGSGIQQLEVGGSDMGNVDPGGSNFGFGQLSSARTPPPLSSNSRTPSTMATAARVACPRPCTSSARAARTDWSSAAVPCCRSRT